MSGWGEVSSRSGLRSAKKVVMTLNSCYDTVMLVMKLEDSYDTRRRQTTMLKLYLFII